MDKLKPCPFCGCKDMRVVRDIEAIIERHRAVCFECAAHMYRGTPKKVIEAWNRRADDGKADYVVRCRERKYHKDTSVKEYAHCSLTGYTVEYDDFCSYGERKDGDGNG